VTVSVTLEIQLSLLSLAFHQTATDVTGQPSGAAPCNLATGFGGIIPDRNNSLASDAQLLSIIVCPHHGVASGICDRVARRDNLDASLGTYAEVPSGSG
jgi:hypothetical protein